MKKLISKLKFLNLKCMDKRAKKKIFKELKELKKQVKRLPETNIELTVKSWENAPKPKYVATKEQKEFFTMMLKALEAKKNTAS